MSSFGVSIPGVTTLRDRVAPGSWDISTSGRTELCIVFDDSGSMSGSSLRWARSVALSLIRAARRRRELVSAIIFGDSVCHTSRPGTDYATLERRLVRCAAMSGGTHLAGALLRAASLPRRSEGVTTCVISDGDFTDAATERLSDALVRLTTLGPVVIFANGSSPRKRPDWLPPVVQWRARSRVARSEGPSPVPQTLRERDA